MSDNDPSNRTTGMWDVVSRVNKGFWIWADKNPRTAAVLVAFASTCGGVVWMLDRHKEWGPAILASPIWSSMPSGYVLMLVLFLLWRQWQTEKRSLDCEKRERIQSAEIENLSGTVTDLFAVATNKQKFLLAQMKKEREQRVLERMQDRRKVQLAVENERRGISADD